MPVLFRMKARFAALSVMVGVALLGSVSSICHAQVSSEWTGPVAVALEDWGIEDALAIRAGQLSVIYERDAPRLATYYLAPEAVADTAVDYRSYTPSDDVQTLKVSDFDRENRNRLGGYFNVFQSHPSTARVAIKTLSDSSRALSFTGFRGDAGFCGMWVHLFDFSLSLQQREYLDVRRFSRLEFFVKRTSADVDFLIKVADAEWESREDAIVVGNLGEFAVDDPASQGWERISIPIERLPSRLNKRLMASIVFEQVSEGHAQIFIRSMSFTRHDETEAGLEPPELPDPAPIDFATWIWNTEELQARDAQRDSVLDFLTAEEVNTIYLQLPHQRATPPRKGEIDFDRERMRALVSELTQRGFRTYALDGYAYYALPEFHDGVLSTVQNVIDYNAVVEAEAQFAGVRYDIEPYLMPGFHGPSQQRMLTGLLSLLEKISSRAHEAELALGADIPFWYDARSEYTGRPVSVNWNGVDKPVSEHIIDIVDDVAVMDYRTTAYGADGTIRHAAGEIEYSNEVGKPLYIALETHPLPDELLLDFSGVPSSELPADPGQVLAVVGVNTDSLMLFYALDLREEEDASLRKHLIAAFDQEAGDSELFWWKVNRPVFVPADKISFANHGIDRFRETVSETVEALSVHPSFRGIAVHHSASFRNLASGVETVTASH